MSAFSLSPLGPKIAAFIAVMVAIAIPFRASGVVTQQVPMGLALIGALALCYMSADVRQWIKQALTSKTAAFVGVIILAWAITIPFSLSPLGSAKIGGRTFLFLFSIILVWAALKSHENVHELLWKTLVVSAFTCTAATLLSLLDVPLILSVMKANLRANEAPQQAFKAFAASELCLIPIVIWAGRRLGGNWRFWSYAHAPLAVSVIMLTHNRAALAGLLAMIGIVIISIVFAKHRHTKILLVLAAGAGVAIMAWVRSDRLPLVAAHIPGTYLPVWLIDPHRQFIWKFASENFLNHPWLGNGIDQISKLPGAKQLVAQLGSTASLIPSHPHNWALEILTEAGIIGFIPVIAALTYITWQPMKRFVRTQDEDALAQIALMAGFWASALFNFSIWAVWWQLTFFILFAIVSAAPQRKN
jgi:O-antigen ligase